MTPIRTVAIGTRIQRGAFGGGNQFAKTLTDWLRKQNIEVVHDLNHPAIDIVLITTVKPWARAAAFDIADAFAYAGHRPNTALVLRVNECDQRKGHRLKLLNRYLRSIIKQVDHSVFVSKWLRQAVLPYNSPLHPRTTVIHSGADDRLFNATGSTGWNHQNPLRIVTHHWSSSWYKGWDVYQALDSYLGTPAGKPYQFTYIGNPWPKAHLRNTAILPPQSGTRLADLLKHNHLYISGSQNEPAGMHVIEAVACGLPVLWRQSGSMGEYCAPYGISYTGPNDIVPALQEIQKNYYHWQRAAKNAAYTAEDMCRQYLNLFERLTTVRHLSKTPFDLRLQQGLLWIRDSLS